MLLPDGHFKFSANIQMDFLKRLIVGSYSYKSSVGAVNNNYENDRLFLFRFIQGRIYTSVDTAKMLCSDWSATLTECFESILYIFICLLQLL